MPDAQAEIRTGGEQQQEVQTIQEGDSNRGCMMPVPVDAEVR